MPERAERKQQKRKTVQRREARHTDGWAERAKAREQILTSGGRKEWTSTDGDTEDGKWSESVVSLRARDNEMCFQTS